jgi:TolB protein
MYGISAARAGLGGIAWVGEERLAHGMLQGDTEQVFVTDVASKASRALTAGPAHAEPAVSRDGRALVVVRKEGDSHRVWRIDLDTGSGQLLSEGPFDAFPTVSADGSSVVYASAEEAIRLLKVPGEGGASAELSARPTWCPDVSLDGDLLCITFPTSGEQEAVLLPLAGGEPRALDGIPAAARVIRFGPDDRSITWLVSHEGADEIWGMPLGGGEPERLARFDGMEIDNFAWSPDGTRLAVVKISRSGDVVLLKRTPA